MSSGITQHFYLERLRQHLPLAVEGRDPEGVHQVRVAALRLRVWLILAGRTEGEPELRRFRRDLSRLRDLDVLLMETQQPEIRGWLQEQWTQCRVQALPVLRDPALLQLLRELETLPGVYVPDARILRAHLARKALAKGRRLGKKRAEFEDFHRLRRAVRRVRYAQEFLDEDPTEIKWLQSALGRLNDAEVALALAVKHPEPKLARSWSQDLREGLKGQRKEAQQAWKRVKPTLKQLRKA